MEVTRKRVITLVLTIAILAIVAFVLYEHHPSLERSPAEQTSAAVHPPEGLPTPTKTGQRTSLTATPLNVGGAKPHLTHSRPEAVPDGNYADFLPTLKQRATAGEATASYQIFSMLEDCKRMFRDHDDDATNAKRLEKCAGLTQEDLDSSVKWLQTAADAGSAEAMLAYPLYATLDLTVTEALKDPQALQDYKDRSKRYLETAAAAGLPGAMYTLSTAYARGSIVPQDWQLAYAYAYASQLATHGSVDETEFPFTQYSSSLTAEQIESARLLGSRIRAGCCR